MTDPIPHIPELETERLRLRAPRREDFEPYAEVLMSDRSRYMNGPFDLSRAWTSFVADAGGWMIDGFGYWSVDLRESGRFVAFLGFGHPPDFPEPELGWAVLAGAEGHGYATEAARAALAHWFGPMGKTTAVSYIDPENARSIALAERLGAVRDGTAARPDPSDLVYRHGRPA